MPESDVEVNNAWSCTSVRPIGLNDVPHHESILYRGTKVEARDNVIDMVTRLQAGLSKVRIPAGTQDLRFLQNVRTCSGVHPASYSMGTGDSSRGLSWANVIHGESQSCFWLNHTRLRRVLRH